jgi:hypothetical protein
METLILLAVFILIPLANYVLERMRRRYEPSPPASGRGPDMGMRRQAPPPAPVSSTGRERAREAPPVAIQPARSPGIRQPLFRSKRDLRRTIIAMTILGPCRASDPPD